jgi:hypothetical protein
MRSNMLGELLSHPALLFAGIVVLVVGWQVGRMLWFPGHRQLSAQDLAVLQRAAALEKQDPAAAEALVRTHFAPRVQAEESERAALWVKVNLDRAAALELRQRVLSDIRVYQAHCEHLSPEATSRADELVSAQAALSKAQGELRRLDAILARPQG